MSYNIMWNSERNDLSSVFEAVTELPSSVWIPLSIIRTAFAFQLYWEPIYT